MIEANPWSPTDFALRFSGRVACCYAAMLVLTLCFVLRAEASGATNAPVIWVENHDFGVVPPQFEVNHEFTWRNESVEPLRVLKIEPSCECLQVISHPYIIEPKTEGRISVRGLPKQTVDIAWILQAEVAGNTNQYLFSLSGKVEGVETHSTEDSLLIQPKELLGNPVRLQETLFVDVRSQEKFRLGHIPHSLNFPLYTLKGRGFLKSRELILINEGHENLTLLSECRRLKQYQFKSVRVLAGGIRFWQQSGGGLEGENPRAPALATLSPGEYFQAREEQGWLVLILGGDASSSGLFPADQTISGPDALVSLRQALSNAPNPRLRNCCTTENDAFSSIGFV